MSEGSGDGTDGLDRLLEVFLVVGDLPRACRFYGKTLALEPYGEPSDRGCLFHLPGGQLLGLVDGGVAAESNRTPGGRIPAVVQRGGPRVSSAHLAFAVAPEQIDGWRDRLESEGVTVLTEVGWEKGGRSLYFRDPDGHLLEIVSPGVWDFY